LIIVSGSLSYQYGMLSVTVRVWILFFSLSKFYRNILWWLFHFDNHSSSIMMISQTGNFESLFWSTVTHDLCFRLMKFIDLYWIKVWRINYSWQIRDIFVITSLFDNFKHFHRTLCWEKVLGKYHLNRLSFPFFN
jgi:hypothetical protein